MRRLIKWCAYALTGVLLLFLIALVAVRLLFGRDEPATELAQRWNTPAANEAVPDPDNAWLWLIGQGAAEAESPVAFGRRRLDAYHVGIRLASGPEREAALVALPAESLPVAADPVEHGRASAGCPYRDMDCIDWAGRVPSALASLAAANRVRLDRYDRTLDLSRYEEAAQPSLHPNEPMPDASVARIAHLHLDLIARDLAQGLALDAALTRLTRVADFWRRAAEQGRTLRTKRTADVMLERCWRLGDNLIDHLPKEARPRISIAADALWREPSPAYRDIVPELHRMNLLTIQGTEEILGVGGLPPACLPLPAYECLKTLFMRAAYAPQSTRNLLAATHEEVATVWRAEPGEYDRTRERSGAAIIALHPVLGEGGDFVDLFRRGNPTGRVLVAIAIPAYAHGIEPRHDTEAVRRLFVLKHLSRQRGLPPSDMPAFLAAQPAALRHPFSGEPFEWDATLQELAYAPRSTSWRRERLGLSLGERIGDGVHDCHHPMRYRFRRRDSETEASELAEARGCGAPWSDGSIAEPTTEDPADPQAWRRLVQFEHLSIASTPTDASLRLLWRDEERRLLAYESLHFDPDGEYRPMQALGHDDGAMIEVSATPLTETPLVRVAVRDVTVRDLGEQLRRVKGVQLHGIETCPSERITMNFSAVPVDAVVMLMGDVCGRQARRLSAGVYRLEASEPAE